MSAPKGHADLFHVTRIAAKNAPRGAFYMSKWEFTANSACGLSSPSSIMEKVRFSG
jgi:hypothetical protein